MKRGKSLLALALVFLLLFGQIGAPSAWAAGPDGEPFAAVEETPEAQAPSADGLLVIENNPVIIAEEETPLAAGPAEEFCCVLHLLILTAALLVMLYYVYDDRKRQQIEFETRRQIGA